MNKEIENELKKSRVDFVHFVDISKLTNRQNRGLPCAILIGIAISPKFVKDVFNNPDYKPALEDEYVKTENRVGEVTDELAEFLVRKGYKLFHNLMRDFWQKECLILKRRSRFYLTRQ